jgi:hypothetical protein
MIAANAAAPICPRCGRRVRTGVEIHSAAAELAELLFRLEPLRLSGHASDRDLHETVMLLIGQAEQELRTELVGEHLSCYPVRGHAELFDHALARAHECVAPDRPALQ